MQFDGTEKYKVYDLISGKRKRLVDGDTSIKPQKVWYCTEEAMNSDDYKRVTDEIWKEAFLDENDVVKMIRKVILVITVERLRLI